MVQKKGLTRIFHNSCLRQLFGYMFTCIFLVMFGNAVLAQEPVVLDETPYEQISLQSAIEKYRLKSIPVSLEKMRGVHPRIFLNEERITELREKVKTTYASYWEETRKQADRYVETGPPDFLGDNVGRYGFERGWMGTLGYKMRLLAAAYVITDEQRYLDSAREWALASCSYPTWAGLGWLDGMDLSSSRQMMGLALIYDWCYEGLGEKARRIIRETLVKRASAMFEVNATETRWWPRADYENNAWVQWNHAYIHNHLWLNCLGMTTAGLALFDEEEEALQWLGFSLDKYQRTMEALGPDGASIEGVGYGDAGIEYILPFLFLSRELLDEDLYDSDFLRNVPKFRLYMGLPRNAWTRENNIINFGDSKPGNGLNIVVPYGLANEYQDGYAQWTAHELDESNIVDWSGPWSGPWWLTPFWNDPEVKVTHPEDLPTLFHFEDVGIVSARSDWSGDESLVAFKCGPYIGHKAIQELDYNPSMCQHVHPDVNHFMLFGAGEWLIRDDGYVAKWTDQHNTLRIDGKGQFGEGVMWFDGSELHRLKARPRVTRSVTTPEFDQITGDGTEAYPQNLGLKRFVRHLLFLKPDVLIVVDDITCDKERELELRFHPQQHTAEIENNSLIMRGKKATLRLTPLTDKDVNVTTDNIKIEDGSYVLESEPLFTVQLSTKRAQWRNAVALSWAKTGSEPQTITMYEKGDTWVFLVGNRKVELDWKTGEAKELRTSETDRNLIAKAKKSKKLEVKDEEVEREKQTSIDLRKAISKYRLKSVPASLEKMRGVHPRIYLNDEVIAELREKIKTTHADYWAEVRRQAIEAVESGPPEYTGDAVGRWGFEQLWMRGIGNTMSTLAMAYVLTGEQRYLDSAREWALTSCGYKTWGGLWDDGMDLATGMQLFGLGLVYDWCYDELGEDARKIIRETLIRRTSVMFETAALERQFWPRTSPEYNIWVNWHRAFLQNHIWVNTSGMAVAGLALFDGEDDASQWIGFAQNMFQHIMVSLGPDGASHEGVSYWRFGLEHLLKFMHLSRELLDVDMYNHDWFHNSAKYRQYLLLPRQAWTPVNNVVDIGDCSRANWNSDYQMRALAQEYRDGYAQWIAEQIDAPYTGSSGEQPYFSTQSSGVVFAADSHGAQWLNLLWYDPTVKAKPPTDLPTLYHFKDMEIVSARTDWSGDESLVVFKCGPYMGHKAIQDVPYNRAACQHVHPDVNHFVVFGNGEWLIRDDGYKVKWTDQHNTLLIDGKGQLGEGVFWFDGSELYSLKAQPRIIRAVSTPELDHLTGDGTEAYPRDAGLKHFVRHLLFLKPDVLIVADDIVLEKPRELELRFHPEQHQAERDDQALLMHGKQAVLRLDPLTAEDVKITAEDIDDEDTDGGVGLDPLFTVRLATKRAKWRNAVALSWTKTNEKPVKVILEEKGDKWIFTAGERVVVLDWRTGKAEIQQ